MEITVKVNNITGEYRTMQVIKSDTYKRILFSLFDAGGTIIVRFNGKEFEVSIMDIVKSIINEVYYKEKDED